MIKNKYTTYNAFKNGSQAEVVDTFIDISIQLRDYKKILEEKGGILPDESDKV